jgi:HEAT repeat protein
MKRVASIFSVAAAGVLMGGCAAGAGAGSATAATTAKSSTPPLERSILLLQEDSRSNDPAIRANCIEALQPSNDPRAENVIDQGLHDPVWIVRFSAAMATGKRRTAQLKPVLLRLATTDDNDSVRVAAIYALHRLGDDRNMNTLAQTLNSSDPSTRANTALVLGLMGNPSAIPLLQSHASEADPRVKFEITAAMARLGDSHAQDIIASLAISKFAEDQWNAMSVCPELPPDLAANALVLGLQNPSNTPPALQDLTTRRQLVAARSLGKMHSAQGAKIAIDNLANPNPSLRALAAFAMGELLAPQQDGSLAPLLEDKEENVRLAAAAAIVNIWSRGTGK